MRFLATSVCEGENVDKGWSLFLQSPAAIKIKNLKASSLRGKDNFRKGYFY